MISVNQQSRRAAEKRSAMNGRDEGCFLHLVTGVRRGGEKELFPSLYLCNETFPFMNREGARKENIVMNGRVCRNLSCILLLFGDGGNVMFRPRLVTTRDALPYYAGSPLIFFHPRIPAFAPSPQRHTRT